jgi:hypothetical protein
MMRVSALVQLRRRCSTVITLGSRTQMMGQVALLDIPFLMIRVGAYTLLKL